MSTMAARRWARRRGPEVLLAVLAGVVFLGFLGALDLWGKREQRAAAEALDTVENRHWLVAQIQGRPRLEKPPLPRWTIATLILLTGHRDEWVVRLPGALSALGMVGLVYGLGCRLAGRSAGLASGLALTSMPFFVAEVRQAGNDGPLALFTALTLYSAWRRLHGAGAGAGPAAEGEPAGARRWNLAFFGAMGLGFLTKGPIILALVALTLVPYLAVAGRLRRGLGLLADARGLLLFVALALSWPVPVLLADPNALRVWSLEISQKVGGADFLHHRSHQILAADWFWMTAPWVVVATMAVLLPLLPRGRAYRPAIWFPWWWAVGNLAMFCAWSVAKPNYYLPCLPGVALLVGIEWVRMSRAAREPLTRWSLARPILQFHWVALFVAALVAPVAARQVAPHLLGWTAVFAAVVAVAVVASAWAWRRGADAGALMPLVAAWAVAILIGYGGIMPAANATHSHRNLATTMDRLLPPEARTVMFFHEIDEGLWFYLRDRALVPVPGSQPEYNDGLDLYSELRSGPPIRDPRRLRNVEQQIFLKRQDSVRQTLLDWIARPDRVSSYVLLRNRDYDRFAPALAGLATPVFREQGLKRNGLVLLHVDPQETVAARNSGHWRK
ncbi:MAG: glycosyltransferase family 39 protein [Planctomycetaceae bacterium]|nr:glycosyltransferase family 39 protein [Planctomycetaceae bacterium]